MAAADKDLGGDFKQLVTLQKQYEDIAGSVRRKAQLHDRLEKSANAMIKEAQEYLDSLRLDDPEEDVARVLEERVAAIGGAKTQRVAKPADPALAGAPGRHKETSWIIEYTAASEAAGEMFCFKCLLLP